MTDDAYDEDVIEVEADKPFRMSPDGMRALRKATGVSLTDILQNDDEPEQRMQAIAFGQLYRRLQRLGHLPDAGELWERAGRADIVMIAPAGYDPFGAESSTTSPRSAVTGE